MSNHIRYDLLYIKEKEVLIMKKDPFVCLLIAKEMGL
jgi:hypothetical protein